MREQKETMAEAEVSRLRRDSARCGLDDNNLYLTVVVQA